MGFTNPRTPAIFENVGVMLQACMDIQEAIDVNRRTFAADDAFIAMLDKLQAELDRKAEIFYRALRDLQGIEERTNDRPSG